MVGGRFQYLTIISMWFSMIYQFLKIALPKSVRYICNYLILPTFVLQLIVFTLFWTLYSINPLLLQSKRLENESSIYRINSVFVTHLLPSIIMSVEWWLHCKNNSNNSGNRLYNFASIDRNDGNHMRKIHRTLITTWSGLYLVWVLYLYRVNGKWVYPFLKLLNVWQWIALTICSVSLGLLLESICKQFCCSFVHPFTYSFTFFIYF